MKCICPNIANTHTHSLTHPCTHVHTYRNIHKMMYIYTSVPTHIYIYAMLRSMVGCEWPS